MAKKALVVAVMLVFLSSAAAQAMLKEPDGFGGIPWGVLFEEVSPDFIPAGGDPATATMMYERKNQDMSMGKAALSDILYVFWQGRFFGTMITTPDRANYDALKSYLTYNHGAGFKVATGTHQYVWNGNTTIMMLRLEKDHGTLMVASKEQYTERNKKK